MQKRRLLGVTALVLFVMTVLTVSLLSLQQEPPAREQAALKQGEPLPDALDSLYPPKAQDERKYYVDSSVLAMVEELAKATAEPSPEKADKIHQGIGMESCHKCHLVHIPAAFAQKKMKR